MSTDPQTDKGELESLRRRVADLERELTERTERANAAIAAAEDKSYWLDRWGIDLNALMRKRGAAEMRAGVRAARAIYRGVYDLRARSKRLGPKLRFARAKLEEERSRR
jgi:hypothetical protein